MLTEFNKERNSMSNLERAVEIGLESRAPEYLTEEEKEQLKEILDE